MRAVALLIALSLSLMASAQDEVLTLFPEGIPCANEHTMEIVERADIGRVVSKVHDPTLAVYRPDPAIANGTAVVICPGGGYTILAYDWEGTRMAEWFNSLGVTAFVLKNRLPRWESEECRHKVALLDAQRAMRLVRMKAGEYAVDPHRIGVMGFSAGGHLASTLSTHFDAGDPNASQFVDRENCRPDFSILMYPVISMDPAFGHMGSRTNLMGENPSADMIEYFSNEKQITEETPPAILIHASDDKAVPVKNSIVYYEALLENNVSAAMHIYEEGGHGFSFGEGRGAVAGWRKVCEDWMSEQGFLTPRLQALIIDGQNNHKNWPETTPILKDHLLNTGLFMVDIATTPASGEDMSSFAPDFSKYDVVVSNYNGEPWSAKTQQAFEDFVKNGGGFVSVHAANNAFPNWKAYNEMIGLGGWYGRTEKDGPYVYYNDAGEKVIDDSPGKGGHHGKVHEFTIQVRDSVHPIMAGLPTTWRHTADELYDQLRGPAQNMHVLATAYSDPDTGGVDRHEPMLMSIHYGLGRVFHTTLGHLNESQLCQGFATTFQRGTEWAATGSVTQPVPDRFPGEEETMMVEKK